MGVAVALAVVASMGLAACSTKTITGTVTKTVTVNAQNAPREISLYGHIKSLTSKGAGFELRFDPAEWLGGETANRAAIEDGLIPPGDVVPNDYYIRDEGHRLLTYFVPANAPVTVVTNQPGQGIRPTAITVSELVQILEGKNPAHRRIFDRGNHLGFWIRVATDTVRSLEQQYQP
jgi:hypothetical protein